MVKRLNSLWRINIIMICVLFSINSQLIHESHRFYQPLILKTSICYTINFRRRSLYYIMKYNIHPLPPLLMNSYLNSPGMDIIFHIETSMFPALPDTIRNTLFSESIFLLFVGVFLFLGTSR